MGFLALAWEFASSKLGMCVLGIIAALLIVHSLKDSYDAKHEAIGAARVQMLWDADKAARIKAFSDMTTQWITAQVDGEKAGKERDAAHAQMALDATRRRATLPAAVADLRVPLVAGLLNDVFVPDSTAAASTARGAATRPANSTGGPDTSVGLWTDWSIAMKDLYATCRDEVIGWQSFYQSLRDKQGKPEATP